MKRNNPQPHWWKLYGILPIFALLAWIVTRAGLSGLPLELAQVGIILVVFFLANRWVSDNAAYFLTSVVEKESPDFSDENPPAPLRSPKPQNALQGRVVHSFLAIFIVLGATWVMALIGQNLLGGGVIALVYLAPVIWLTVRWGQVPGLAAALTAAMCFDFYFIPPYGTFQVGSLEGWLLLILFAIVSVFVVGRAVRFYQSALRKERDADFLIELVALLGGLQDRDEVAGQLAESLRRFYQAGLVKVVLYQRNGQPSVLKVRTADSSAPLKSLPGRYLPVLSGLDLVGEITIAQAAIPLPDDDDPLLRSVCHLAALAVDRVHPIPGGLKTLGNGAKA